MINHQRSIAGTAGTASCRYAALRLGPSAPHNAVMAELAASKRTRKTRKRRRPVFNETKATELYEILSAERPNPRTELNFVNPYTLLVAVALSAQATDKGVNKATEGLFAIADTPQKMLALGLATVETHIKTIGLWRNKAKNVIALSEMLIEEFDGDVPQTREELVRLPGVGRKTANVVMNEAFGKPTIAVDTHIFRVANRTGLAPGSTPDEVESQLERATPEKYKLSAHHWLILHGRYTCVARKPKCWMCGISHLCKFKLKTAAPS
ncbi:MAG: endonuclease III [Pseudomonadota bacterium]